MKVLRSGHEYRIAVLNGETVFQALRRAGLSGPHAVCGGKGICKKCLVEVEGVGQVLSCRTLARDEDTVILPEEQSGAVIASEGCPLNFPLTAGEGLGIAADIGTTTVAVQLYDLTDGALLGTCCGVNAQCPYGADVIARIRFTDEKESGLHLLSEIISKQLSEYVDVLCRKAGRNRDQVRKTVIAANTVISHLYAELSPSAIAAAPYTPMSLFGVWERDHRMGTDTYIAPAVAGYVGGDITAGMVACGMDRTDRTVLYLDLGTNGEIALTDGRGGFLCCAAAAGPAFEGGCISQGMAACDGAISEVTLIDGVLNIQVLGGGSAKGICGSGLVDALAVMLELGAVDETGRLLTEHEAPERARPYLKAEGFRLAPEVYVTGADVRQLQLAKAAVAAGIATVLEEAGLKEENVDSLYLAGGFGNYIRKESAVGIGLLPQSMLERIVPVGNSAGQGAAAVLLSQQARDTIEGLPARCHYIELSGHKGFNQHFIEQMIFE